MLVGGDAFLERAIDPNAVGQDTRHRVDRAGAGSGAAHLRLDHAGDLRRLPYLCGGRPVPAAAVDALRHGSGPHRRPYVHDARRHLRRRDRRVVVADHPVHDLRRIPAVFRRGQILHRLLVRRDGRQADRRRAHDRAGVIPARRAFGQRRGHDRNAGHRRIPDAHESGLRQRCRRRPARCGRPRRDHLAAGARRGRVPDRRSSSISRTST